MFKRSWFFFGVPSFFVLVACLYVLFSEWRNQYVPTKEDLARIEWVQEEFRKGIPKGTLFDLADGTSFAVVGVEGKYLRVAETRGAVRFISPLTPSVGNRIDMMLTQRILRPTDAGYKEALVLFATKY